MSMEIRSLKESELEEHAELVYVSYSHEEELQPGSMLTRPDWWLQGIRSDPYYKPEQTRVMVMDGRLVSSVSCYIRQSYIDGRTAKTVCIGSVCTHPEYRRRGLLRQVLRNAIEWMTEHGILWSYLYGSEDIYGSSGWRNMTAWSLDVDLNVSECFGKDISIRAVEPERDVHALVKIYNSFNSQLTGPTCRTVEYWQRRILGKRATGFYILERNDQAIGYYAEADGGVFEIGWLGSPRDILAAVLRQWPGRTVYLPICNSLIIEDLQGISIIPTQKENHDHSGSITLNDCCQGLWQYHQDPDGIFPEFDDTEGLIRFLREHDYVMWSVDEC